MMAQRQTLPGPAGELEVVVEYGSEAPPFVEIGRASCRERV